MNINYEKDFKRFSRDYNVNSTYIDDYYNNLNTIHKNMSPYVFEEREMRGYNIDVYTRLMRDRLIIFSEDFRADNMSLMIAQYLYLCNLSDEPIKMYINSPGGNCIDGLGLIDTIYSCKPRFEPTIMGMGASMGSVLSTIKKLHPDDPEDIKSRRMLKHSRLMIHDIRGGTSGTYKDQVISLELSKELRDELFTILSNNSKFNKNEIEEMCNRDMWIKSDKALEYGFTDEIIKYA